MVSPPMATAFSGSAVSESSKSVRVNTGPHRVHPTDRSVRDWSLRFWARTLISSVRSLVEFQGVWPINVKRTAGSWARACGTGSRMRAKVTRRSPAKRHMVGGLILPGAPDQGRQLPHAVEDRDGQQERADGHPECPLLRAERDLRPDPRPWDDPGGEDQEDRPVDVPQRRMHDGSGDDEGGARHQRGSQGSLQRHADKSGECRAHENPAADPEQAREERGGTADG